MPAALLDHCQRPFKVVCYLHHQRYDILELGSRKYKEQANTTNKNKTSGDKKKEEKLQESRITRQQQKKKELEGGRPYGAS